ncbi:hypothetical protein V6N11_055466 [Hibiscus sabdariffa]|uniref:Uncharacterized protein n=1 Tax=Hibiscus sabdariffa TaxID=183260 RepID=A0ABR2PFQ7_9ROSI
MEGSGSNAPTAPSPAAEGASKTARANLLTEYEKTQANNEKLKASILEAQKELAEMKALLSHRTDKSESPLATYEKMEVELHKLKELYKDFA